MSLRGELVGRIVRRRIGVRDLYRCDGRGRREESNPSEVEQSTSEVVEPSRYLNITVRSSTPFIQSTCFSKPTPFKRASSIIKIESGESERR